MREIISIELLSLVLEIEIRSFTYTTIPNEMHYIQKGKVHQVRLNLDTLGRLCKEWLYKNDIHLSIERTIPLDIQNTTWFIELERNYGFHDISELEAIIKVTEWVAKEKGLL